MKVKVMEEKRSIFEKLISMRIDFIKAGVKRTGRNIYSKYDYYTLDDFLSVCTKIAAEHKVLILYSIDDKTAKLSLHNIEETDEVIVFSMPLAEASVKGASAIQNLGSLMTYTKRYLYMDAFEISDPDVMDENLNANEQKTNEQTAKIIQEPITEAKVKMIQSLMNETGVTEAVVCKQYGVERIEDIKEGQFKNVINSFEKTKKMRADARNS